MGYMTRFTLNVQLLIADKIAALEDETPLRAVIAQLREENEEAEYTLDEDGSSSGEEGKWYEHTKDLRAFSTKHPMILFTLHGEGEESGDIWNEYYLNGRCQVAKSVLQIAKFDPKELK